MSIRLGTASPATQPSPSATLSLLSSIASRAASKDIDILLLPEAFIGGYPRGSHFGSVVGSRSKGGRQEFASYFAGAADLGDIVGEGGAGAGAKWIQRDLPAHDLGEDTSSSSGPSKNYFRGDGTRERVEEIAKQTGVFLVVGIVERAGGSLYCSVVYVDPHRGMIGKRRKVLPTGTERLIWAQSHPSTLRAVSTTIRGTRVNLAAAICWENYMPLLRQTLYSQNINLYLAPTADGREAWLSLMRTIGVEGRCFVVSSNMAVRGSQGDSSGYMTSSSVHRDVAPDEKKPAKLRRNSTITEDGHEIALPCSSGSSIPETNVPRAPLRKRRKSVLDKDGNEIVLCCDAETDLPQGQDGSLPVRERSRASVVTDSATAIPEDEESPTFTNHLNDKTSSLGTSHPPGTSGEWISRGGSCIISPFGDVLAGPQWEDDDGLVFADVDFAECIHGRLDLDTAGSYSRNDAFRFKVDGLDLDPLPYY